MGEIKQANFRVDSDSADAFRKFCDEQGYNQAQGFDHLIQVLELNRAKAGIEGRLTEITTFEEYIKKIMDSYLTSLQVAQNTEERVREDFKTDINLRDRALADSERKIIEKDKKIAALIEEATEAKKIAKEAALTAENAEKQAASSNQITEETRRVNKMFSAKLTESERKLSGYDELKKSEENLKSKITDIQHKNEMIQAEITHVNSMNDKLTKDLTASNKKLSNAKETITDIKMQIISLKRDLDEQKKESKQAQELAVERAVKKAEKDMQEQIALLRDEKTRLQVQIEMLSSKEFKATFEDPS